MTDCHRSGKFGHHLACHAILGLAVGVAMAASIIVTETIALRNLAQSNGSMLFGAVFTMQIGLILASGAIVSCSRLTIVMICLDNRNRKQVGNKKCRS